MPVTADAKVTLVVVLAVIYHVPFAPVNPVAVMPLTVMAVPMVGATASAGAHVTVAAVPVPTKLVRVVVPSGAYVRTAEAATGVSGR